MLLLIRVGDGPLLSEGTLKVFVAFAIGGLLGGEEQHMSAEAVHGQTMQRRLTERRSLADCVIVPCTHLIAAVSFSICLQMPSFTSFRTP